MKVSLMAIALTMILSSLEGCTSANMAPQDDPHYVRATYSSQVPADVFQQIEADEAQGYLDSTRKHPKTIPTIAVKEFSTSPDQPDLGRSFADMVAASLVNFGQFRVVEREHLPSILSELEFSQTGLADIPPDYEFGRMYAVDYLITGGISQMLGEQSVEIRAMDVLTGEIVAAHTLVVERLNATVANSLAAMLMGKMQRR